MPVAVRHGGDQARSAGRPAMGARHARRRPGLVEEHQAGRVETGGCLGPGAARLGYVGAVLLGRAEPLFLRVSPSRVSTFHMT